jgi:ABC-type multidrug transport system ATPase subunit
MTISLEKIGKRYNYEWIFRGLDFDFLAKNRYAILGPNGSGKSTLLQIIAGSLSHNEGRIAYSEDAATGGRPRVAGEIFRYLSRATPYLELIEAFTLTEALRFHGQFKPFLNNMPPEDIIGAVHLEKAAHKEIRYFSSGMKQRAKLAQAIFSDTPVLLLDEPCTNLDEAGVSLYHALIEQYTKDRLVIISSNDAAEYDLCQTHLHIADYKT